MNDFEEIYEIYHKDIFLFILRIVNHQTELAEELTQETFYQAFTSLHRFKGTCKLKTWICQIAKNVCFKYFKKNPIHMSIDNEFNRIQDTALFVTSLEQEIIDKEIRAYFMDCIQNLGKKYRDVLMYRIYFEMSFAEIAESLNISESSAKVIFHRGKEKLQSQLKKNI
ncbi:MAG: RNA polymerase sigma factor [Cellulosilyticaceae bacterium]